MDELISAIRAAVVDASTAEQKATGVIACRTIVAVLEAEVGKPITLPGVPAANPLAGITSDQALDLVIARLQMLVDAKTKGEGTMSGEGATAPTAPMVSSAMRMTFASQPPRAHSSPRTGPPIRSVERRGAPASVAARQAAPRPTSSQAPRRTAPSSAAPGPLPSPRPMFPAPPTSGGLTARRPATPTASAAPICAVSPSPPANEPDAATTTARGPEESS